MHIAIITWWDNSEREISLISAQAVKTWLTALGYTMISWYDFPSESTTFVTEHQHTPIDFVFLMIHGAGGEDGQIASFLDLLAIPYHCTSPAVLALTLNKRHTKLVRRAHGIPVADDFCFVPTQTTSEHLIKQITSKFWFPCVRKELTQGSSQGVYVLKNEDEVVQCFKKYISYTGTILIEQFIQGDEITIPVLDSKEWAPVALPLIHIIPPADGWFDYENKYNGKTQELCPSGFSPDLCQQVEALAVRAYTAVGCTKYARLDAILTPQGPVFLEINTIPGFTSQSLFPKSAAVAGYTFPELLQHLIDISIS